MQVCRDYQSSAQAAWTAANSSVPFVPFQVSSVSGWLRLAASSQSGGEWTSIVDVINNNPATSNSARRAAVGASSNSLPIATFDSASPDVWSWPLASYNNGTAHWGMAFWIRPTTVTTGGNATLFCIAPTAGGASVAKILIAQNDTTLRAQVYQTDADGRFFDVAGVFALNTWVWIRADWKSSRTGDDRMRFYVNGVQASGSNTDFGTGGFPANLRVATGNGLFGNFQDSVPSGAYKGNIGPNVYVTSDDLTSTEETNLMNFEKPT